MHVNMEQGNLLRGLEQTLGVIDKRGTLPILAHCLVDTNGQGLVISATDLEMSFRGAFPAEVAEQNDKDGKIKLGLMWPQEEQGSLFEETNEEEQADKGPPSPRSSLNDGKQTRK
jgi:hypothetical protein